MFISFGSGGPPRSPMASSALFFNGLLCVVFGLAVLAAPELLAYLVAIILIMIGSSLLLVWWRMRR